MSVCKIYFWKGYFLPSYIGLIGLLLSGYKGYQKHELYIPLTSKFRTGREEGETISQLNKGDIFKTEI